MAEIRVENTKRKKHSGAVMQYKDVIKRERNTAKE